MTYDAVIVGARCAGAATALLLARGGARVLVADKGRYGTDTLSTHALMRAAVMQLDRWGVLPAIVAAGTPGITATTFDYGGLEVMLPIEPRYGVNALYAPRRTVLDSALVDAAWDAGAEIGYGIRVDDVVTDASGRVRGVRAIDNGTPRTIEADLVIGADGVYSTIARRVGAKTLVEGPHAAATLFSYWQGLDAFGYEWRFGREASVGAIPTNGGVCIFAGVRPDRFRREVNGDALAAYRRWIREAAPALDASLDAARRTEPVRGFGGHPGFIKQAIGPGWALVGDAGYFKDPATAHGITDALRDAELLARAILAGREAALAEYEAQRLDLSRHMLALTDEIASFDWTFDHLQMLHRAFSSEMAREVRALAALEPLSCLSPSASVLHVH